MAQYERPAHEQRDACAIRQPPRHTPCAMTPSSSHKRKRPRQHGISTRSIMGDTTVCNRRRCQLNLRASWACC